MKPRRIERRAIILLGLLPLCAGIACAALLWWTLPYVPRTVLEIQTEQMVLGFSPDGGILLTRDNRDPSDFGGPVRLWNTSDGRQQAEFLDDKTGFQSAKITADGRILVIQEIPGSALRLFDLTDGHEVAMLPVPTRKRDHYSYFFLSPDSRTLAYETFKDGQTCLRLWDIPTQSLRATVRGIEGVAWNNPSLVFSPDSKLFASGDSPFSAQPIAAGEVIVRSTLTGDVVSKLTGYEGIAWTLHFSADGSKLLAHSRTDDRLMTRSNDHRAICVWDVHTAKRILKVDNASGGTFVAGDSAILAIARDSAARQNVVKIWDLGSCGEPTEVLRMHPETDSHSGPVALQGGYKVLISESHLRENSILTNVGGWIGRDNLGISRDSRAVQLDLESGEMIEVPDFNANLVSPDGRMIRGTYDGRVALFDVPPRRPWFRIVGWSALLAGSVFFACQSAG